MITTKMMKTTANYVVPRIKAEGGGHKIIVTYNDSIGHYENHLSAAKLIASMFGWTKLTVGDLPDGNYIFLNGSIVEDV